MKTGKMALRAVLISVLLAGLLLAGCQKDNYDDVDGNVLIWQVYAGDGRGNGVSHHFVELYNISEKPVKLDGAYLWYAGAHKFFNEDPENEVDDQDVDTPWEKITLTGTIPGKSSFLILGEKTSASTWWRINMEDGEGDMNLPDLFMETRGFKIALIKGNFQLSDAIQNPFNTDGNWNKVPGYIDMVGALDDASEGDRIFGYEGPTLDYTDIAGLRHARCSNQEAIRRKSLNDTDNNAEDFQRMRYTAKHFNDDGSILHVNGIEDSELPGFKPKNTKYGKWNPIITRATAG